MQNKMVPNRPSIAEETFDFTDADYKPAIIKLYRDWRGEYDNLAHQYKDWVQTAQVYSYNRYDAYGSQVIANVKAYNETIVERKKLAIMMKLIEQQVSLLESYWVSKGYELGELQNTLKTKQLQKLRTATYVKKEEPVAEVEPKENVAPVKAKTLKPIEKKVDDDVVDDTDVDDTDVVDTDDNIDASDEIIEDDMPDETGATDVENVDEVDDEAIDDSDDPDDREDIF